MKQKSEKQLKHSLFKKIRALAPKYRCGLEVPVPYQHIYLPNEEQNILQVWCFKQDIVFYKRLFSKDIRYKESRIATDKNNSLIRVVLEKDTAQNSKDVAMPFVFVETKRRQPSTHDILTYSSKFEKIRTIFPFCKFVFCVFQRAAPRTYRHGVGFDEITSLCDIDDRNEIEDFKKTIRKLLKQAQADLHDLYEVARKIR